MRLDMADTITLADLPNAVRGNTAANLPATAATRNKGA